MLKQIRALMLDVDGVLTNGKLYMDGEHVTKRFDIRDGHAMVLMRKHLDFPIFLISGRDDAATTARAQDLGVTAFQGVSNKVEVATAQGFPLEEVAFVGDDLNDVPLMKAVGFAATPADGCAEAKEVADHVCVALGGDGAVREVCELIVKAQGKWQTLLDLMK